MVQRNCGFALRIAACLVGIGLGVDSQVRRLAQQSPSPCRQVCSEDTIQPVSAGELARALARANQDGAQALLIEMDTPGGLVDSMRAHGGRRFWPRGSGDRVCGPSGARAGSAGFFLLESADVAAMAPGTEAGAAHVVFDGRTSPTTRKRKRWRTTPRHFCARM